FHAPFTITRDQMEATLVEFGFCDSFLKRLDKKAQFEHHWDCDKSREPQKATYLEVGVSTYESDAFLLMVRHRLVPDSPQSTKCLVFFKQVDLLNFGVVELERVWGWLEQHKDSLEQHPL